MIERIRSFGAVVVLGGLLAAGGCGGDAVGPEPTRDALQPSFAKGPNENACWGQASKVFAQMGVMGEHASSFETPRLGLRNLARVLHEQGVIEDDSMQALGAFVADELGLSIAACA